MPGEGEGGGGPGLLTPAGELQGSHFIKVPVIKGWRSWEDNCVKTFTGDGVSSSASGLLEAPGFCCSAEFYFLFPSCVPHLPRGCWCSSMT